MAKDDLAKLKKAVASNLDTAASTNPCLVAAERALAVAPRDPFFLWAALTQLHPFVRDRSHTKFVQPEKWITRDEAMKKLDAHLATSFSVLASKDDGSEEHRMLLRLANLVEGLRKVVVEPNATPVAEAKAHLDVYLGTRELPFTKLEKEVGLGVLWRVLRARIASWEAAKKPRQPKDFLFVPEYVEELDDVLKWALDPVIVRDDFQRWAFEELKARALTKAKPAPRLGSFFSTQLKYEATAPEREMPAIVIGRLLAVLLVGASDIDHAIGDAIRNGHGWGLEALLRAGADPNALWDEDDGSRLLHFAATEGKADCVKVLLQGGADPSIKNKKKQTPLAVAGAKNKAAVVRVLEQGVRPAGVKAASIDTKPIIAAAKKIATKRLSLWASMFGERDAKGELAATLDALASAKLEEWSDLFDGALLNRSPWLELALATAVQSSGAGSLSEAPDGTGVDARFVAGSLTIDGSLVLTAPLVVAGDLTVSGVVIDDDKHGRLVVAGNLRAEGLVTQNDLLVGGNCRLEFLFASGNDHAMMVDGELKAPLVIDDDHAIEAGKEAIAKTVDPSAPEVRARFVKQVFEDGQLSPEKIAKRLQTQTPIFVV